VQLGGDEEEASRVGEMSAIEIAYLTKGLGSLNHLFDTSNKQKEREIKSLIVSRA
jgi:hypothetical protein